MTWDVAELALWVCLAVTVFIVVIVPLRAYLEERRERRRRYLRYLDAMRERQED